jgi:hypothetical protein
MKRILSAIAVAATLVAGLAAADDTKCEVCGKSNPKIDRLKKLAGEWSAGEAGTVTYRLTAGGSAVVESMFPGSPHEMLTIYTAEGDEVKLTHYCMLGNQPGMRTKGGAAGDSLVFECDGKVGNAASHDEQHMHAVTITFVDADHVKEVWSTFEGGKPKGEPHVIMLTRKG